MWVVELIENSTNELIENSISGPVVPVTGPSNSKVDSTVPGSSHLGTCASAPS